MKKIVKHWYDKLLSMLLMLLGFGGSAGLAGCKISVAYGGPPDDYNVKIIPSALSFSAEGGIKEIKIETDSKWTISMGVDKTVCLNNAYIMQRNRMGGKEDALMHYQSLANGGNNYAAALLVWYEIEKNPGRYVNVSSIKQMISQIDYKQSKIGSAIYSEWGNLPCVGDKRAGGTIYSLNYGTHDINIMTDLIRCKYKDRFNVIESKNASSPVRWRLARANEIEYMLANSQTTGVRIVTYENYWILDGTYKWVTGQAKITKISEQILPNTTGAMVLVAEDKF